MKISVNVLKFLIGAIVLTHQGCTPYVKPIDQVYFGHKPTKVEALEKINNYLNSSLFDPYTSKINCSDVTDEAWIWPGYGLDTHYGYLVICDVNAKNRFGGYVGAKTYVFRFNGSEFSYEEHVVKVGYMNKH